MGWDPKRRENSDQLKISISQEKANRSVRSEQRSQAISRLAACGEARVKEGLLSHTIGGSLW